MIAAQHGARMLTHACNAMAATHHREPGPLLAAIHAGMCLELILDGIHLHDAWHAHFLSMALIDAY